MNVHQTETVDSLRHIEPGNWAPGSTAEITMIQPPFLVAVNDRLDRLGKLIDEGRSMAATLRERTMGPWPDEAGKPAGGGDLSEFGQVLGRLDHLIALAATSANHVGALASRI